MMLNNNIIIELLDIANKVVKERGLEYEINLNELEIPLSEGGVGLDSIGRISLLVEIEKRLDISFPDRYWGTETFNSIKEIWEYIAKEFCGKYEKAGVGNKGSTPRAHALKFVNKK